MDKDFRVWVYKGDSLKTGASLAIKHRLYVPGWAIRHILDGFIDWHGTGEIALGFINDEPIAIAIHDTKSINAFCRKALRGNGYASKCVDAIKSKTLVASEGISGTSKFWSKQDVTLRENC